MSTWRDFRVAVAGADISCAAFMAIQGNWFICALCLVAGLVLWGIRNA